MPDLAMSAQQMRTSLSGKTHLFFIAIDEYENGVSRLQNAVRDAKAVSDCLIEHYEFDREHLKMLINEEATRKNIIRLINEYLGTLTEDDNLVFYFSGHGYYHQLNRTGYWLTAESVSGEIDTYLSNDEIIGLIKNIKARHVLGIVDACFSAALFQERSPSLRVSRRYNTPSRWLLTAGRLEPVSDGFFDDHSPFAKTLISQLKYQEKDHIWSGELCNYVLDNFTFNNEKQLPRGQPLSGVGDQGGEFVFVKKGSTLPLTINQTNHSLQQSPTRLREVSQEPLQNKSEVTDINSIKEELTEHLTEGEFKTIFGQLKELITSERKRRSLSLIISRYHKLKDAKISGTRSSKKISLEMNQIQANLLEFINDLREKDL